MAVAPLFVADMPTLLTRIRLEGATAPGALAEIDQATQDTRLEIYRRLGADRLNTILALVYVENPVTDDDYLRMCANNLECWLVRRRLLVVKRTLFADAASGQHGQWNDEGMFGPNTLQGVKTEISQLDVWVEDGFTVLEKGVGVDEPTAVNVDVIGPACPQDLPGGSVIFARRNQKFSLMRRSLGGALPGGTFPFQAGGIQ